MLHYNIPEFDDCDSFLALLAKRSGRMKKGGRPDLNAAAKQVFDFEIFFSLKKNF